MHHQYTPKTINRFWSKVNRTQDVRACWEWLASTTHNGYGQFKVQNRSLRTNRVAWELTYGAIPQGLFVLHTCDNPACCNPFHLELGTHEKNMHDMKIRKRAACGDKNGSRLHPERLVRGNDHPARKSPWMVGEMNGEARLNELQVKSIREQYSLRKKSMRILSIEYGVTKTQISRIIRGISWKHLV
jgi:hypothetical protein